MFKRQSNIIFLSSSRVYSIDELRKIIKTLNINKPIKIQKKIDEKFDTQNPSSLWITKLASEKLIKNFFISNLRYIINRFAVIAGPWQFGKQDQGFVPLWIFKPFIKKNFHILVLGLWKSN